jgi:hypothetical protein
MASVEAALALEDTPAPKVAFLASRGLSNPASLSHDDIRAVCAMALARVPDHRQIMIVQSRPYYQQIDMVLALARYDDLPEGDRPQTEPPH